MSKDGAYLGAVVILAFAATCLSFTKYGNVAAAIALSNACIAASYWWFVISKTNKPIWSDFYWLSCQSFVS